MNPDKSTKARHWGRWGIIIGCLLVLIISFLAIWFYTPLLKSKPQVRIVQPESRLAIRSGDGVILSIEATSRKGFNTLVFLVDDEFESQQFISDPQQNRLNLTFPWYSSQPGAHKLSVVATSSQGIESEPAKLLVLVNPQPVAQVSLSANQVSEALPSEESSEEEIEGVPSEPLEQGVSPENEMNAPQEANVEGVIVENLDWFINEVDEVSNFPVPLPDLPNDQIPWITRFDVTTDRNGDPTNVSVSIGASDDTGLVSIIYSLANLSDPLHPSTQEFPCGGELTCEFSGHFVLTEGSWLLGARAVDVFGQASAISSRQFHILIGDDPQAVAEGDEEQIVFIDPSVSGEDIVLLDMQLDDIGDPQIAEYGCSGQIVYLEVPYTYKSDHGVDVYLGATAESGNVMVAAGHARIQPGSGVARIQMDPIAPDLANQTDQLELYFRTGSDYFYTETSPLIIDWPIPEPDLTITNVEQAGKLVYVSVKNIGCASVENYEISIKTVDDQVVYMNIDQLLQPGAEYIWMGDLNANLLSQGFQVIVDPNNAILEINETNNGYELSAITLDYVQIYQIDIHDISEGLLRGNKGEFMFWAGVNGTDVRSPAGDIFYWSLGKGMFEIPEYIDPFIIRPTLNWDEDLHFIMDGWEDDDGGRDFLGSVDQIHSADMADENSWKWGREYDFKSEYNFYTVYYRIVLKDRH